MILIFKALTMHKRHEHWMDYNNLQVGSSHVYYKITLDIYEKNWE